MGGDAGQRHHVGSGIGTVFSRGNHQRGAIAGYHQGARAVGAHNGQAPGALKAIGGVAHGGGQVSLGRAFPRLLDEVRDNLGVGVRDKGVAVGHQLAAQLLEVLDDAVVNHGDTAGAVQVRMGVAIRGGTMRGPAGVADAAGARGVGGSRALAQRGHTAGALHAMQVARGRDHLNTSGVIAAILKGLQAIEQPGGRLLTSGITNNATHRKPPSPNAIGAGPRDTHARYIHFASLAATGLLMDTKRAVLGTYAFTR